MSDLISRQAVYNVLDKMPIRGFKKDGETIHGLISLSQVNSAIINLPSAQPETHEERTETHACDCISRQAAIDVVRRSEALDRAFGYGHAVDALRDLPSAQPEPLDEWCTDCKEYDHEKHCCPRWNRVIRQTLKDMKEEQPEIIRCKDCKFYHCDGCFFSTAETEEDGFCHYAERRTDEGD